MAENCYVIFPDNDSYCNGMMYKDPNNNEVWTEHYFTGVTIFEDPNKTSDTPRNMFDTAYAEGEVALTDMQKAILFPAE